MFHHKDASVEHGIQHAQGHLFRKVDDNPMINEFGFHVISRLRTFQNQYESFRADDESDETDIDAYDCHATLLHDGTRVYR